MRENSKFENDRMKEKWEIKLAEQEERMTEQIQKLHSDLQVTRDGAKTKELSQEDLIGKQQSLILKWKNQCKGAVEHYSKLLAQQEKEKDAMAGQILALKKQSRIEGHGPMIRKTTHATKTIIK